MYRHEIFIDPDTIKMSLDELITALRKRYEESLSLIPDNLLKLSADRLEMLGKTHKALLSSKFINSIKIEAYKEITELLKSEICKNTYPYFDKDGKPVIIFKAKTGYEIIDDILKEKVGNARG